MIGKIIEIEGVEGLFLVVDVKNNETFGSMSYDKDFWLYPYNSDFSDDIEIKVNDTPDYKLRGMKNTINIREDKKAYTQYGYSVIRGKKTIMLERNWDDVIIPTR